MNALRSLALVLLATGCSIVAATRAPTPEQGAAACANFVDDDQDGTVDCDDPECDGECPEEALAACRDGRDNDGDGVLDAADARCWHFVPPAVTSCATVRGSIVEPAIGDGSMVWRGIAETVPDPRGGTGSVFAPRDRRFRIAPVASSTGALDGLRVRATLRLSQAVETTIELLPSGELGDATSSSGFTQSVQLVLGERIYLLSDEARSDAFIAPDELITPAWVEVELAIEGRILTASLAVERPTLRPIAVLELPSGLSDPVALDVFVHTYEATADLPMLARLGIERADLPACGRTELVPEMRIDGHDLVVGVARGGPGGTTRCAISTNDGAGRPYVAEGDGDWQPASRPIAARGSVLGAAFAWDPQRGAFVGMAARGSSLAGSRNPTSFDRIESPDCSIWTVVPSTLPAIDPSLVVFGRGLSYAVEPDGSHVLRILVQARDVGILTLRSETGDAGTFVMVGALGETGPVTSAVIAGGAELAIEPIGSEDLVLLGTSDRGLIALTPLGPAGRFAELPEPLLVPSDIPGTFDRGERSGPPRLLTSEDPLVARVFYGGTSFGNCVNCLTSGSAAFMIGAGP